MALINTVPYIFVTLFLTLILQKVLDCHQKLLILNETKHGRNSEGLHIMSVHIHKRAQCNTAGMLPPCTTPTNTHTHTLSIIVHADKTHTLTDTDYRVNAVKHQGHVKPS